MKRAVSSMILLNIPVYINSRCYSNINRERNQEVETEE